MSILDILLVSNVDGWRSNPLIWIIITIIGLVGFIYIRWKYGGGYYEKNN